MTIFSLTPTFTQGLIIGQLSILLLLAFILRYLFFDTKPELETLPEDTSNPAEGDALDEKDVKTSSFSAQFRSTATATANTRPSLNTQKDSFLEEYPTDASREESVEWFNFLIDSIAKSYRSDLRGGLPGTTGNEASRRRVERWAQAHLTSSSLSPVKIHAVNLGTRAPRLSNARIRKIAGSATSQTDFDITYTDSISLSLSTSFLFNYPTSLFARLPISLSLSLSSFSGTITLIPPTPTTPFLTLRLLPSFSLKLTQSSLMGSRAKLADVPKVHQMIEERIRASIASRLGEYRIMLPGVGLGGSVNAEGKSVPGALPPGMTKKTVDVFVEE